MESHEWLRGCEPSAEVAGLQVSRRDLSSDEVQHALSLRISLQKKDGQPLESAAPGSGAGTATATATATARRGREERGERAAADECVRDDAGGSREQHGSHA